MTLTDLHYYLAQAGEDQTFTASPALVGAVAYGPAPYVIPDTVVPAITAHIVNADLELVRDLDQSKNRQWIDVADDAGSASCVLRNGDPDLAYLTPGRLIQYRFHGWAAFTSLARTRERIIRDPGEEATQLTTISGPGHIAKLDRSAVLPSRGVTATPAQTDRLFSWPSPEYNDSTWGQAYEIELQEDGGIYWDDEDGNPLPANWPVGSGAWSIWTYVDGAHDEWSPPGTCYFRKDFTTADDINLIIYLNADDRANLYVDGQLLMTTDNGNAAPIEIQLITIFVPAGDHVIAVEATNAPDDPALPGEHNPARIVVAGYSIDPFGVIANPPVFVSDNTWKVLPYPASPPGMTAGEVLRIVLDEWEADGTAPAISRNFSDELDSNGNPWPIESDISTKVGTDGFMFVARELGGTYVDVHMWAAEWRLDAYRIGERGRNRLTVLQSATDPADPTTGNLLRLSATDDLEPITSFLVRWRDAWLIVEDDDAIAEHGRNRVVLGLAAQSASEAQRIAEEQLAIFARLRSEITAEARDDGVMANWPYFQYETCDTILVDQDDEGTQAMEKVLSISVSEDENGVATIVPILRDLFRDRLSAHERALKKSGLGTVDGRSDVANPIGSIVTSQPSCCPPVPAGGGGGG